MTQTILPMLYRNADRTVCITAAREIMSNVRVDRYVEGDWWPDPIPPNVEFGEGFYCESAQIFRKLRSKKSGAIIIGRHVSCYAGCSFSVGEHGRCTIGDFTLLNGALIMADDKIEIGSYCLVSWNVGIADSDFHPARTGPASHRRTSACSLFQEPTGTTQIEDRSCENRKQRLDWHERSDFKRRHNRRKFGCCGGISGHKKRRTEHSRCGESGGCSKTI